MALTRFILPFKRIRTFCMWLTFTASIICITALILYGGIYHTPASKAFMVKIIHGCQVVFIVNILYNLVFFFKSSRKNNKILKWIMDIAVLLTAISLIYPQPQNPWISILEKILYNRWIIFSVLGLYSLIDISFGIIRLLGKRTNPSLLLASSFLFFIFLGALLLMLPRSTFEGISFIDSLFVATSAVSITGLTTVDISEVFTPFGISILALLIQFGALGVLTFTSFFALFFTGSTSIYSQLMVRDMVYSKSANALLPTLLYVITVTFSIEIIGAIAVYLTLPTDFPITDFNYRILFCSFQSLSAFCNAGFTWLPEGMGNPSLMNSNQWIYIVVGTLVILGGIGFPILVNIKNILKEYFFRLKSAILRRCRRNQRQIHLFDVNTKIVLVTTLSIFLITILAFLILEWNNTLAGMSLWEKIAQSYFNSSVPRSSGFSSVNPASFMPTTFLLMIVLMWIGGSSQSTAGGIKVNTFAAMLLNLRSVITEKKYVTVFKRTISVGSIRRANSVVGLSALAYFIVAFILVACEPELPMKALLYEAASAIFTVGSSLGITPELSDASKILLSAAMFVGRVGILSLLMGLCTHRQNDIRIFPYDNIIIN